MEQPEAAKPAPAKYDNVTVGALAHLYRGELYRSKIWRNRLDTTTNWAVATTGIAMSVSFSNKDNTPLPLLLVSMLVAVFLIIEARRYRYFDIWRTRVRIMEVSLYGPLLEGRGVSVEDGWNGILRQDYRKLHFHISYLEAVGRRLRRNYVWIFLVLGLSYLAKLLVHPAPLQTWDELWRRASVGPIPGQFVLLMWLAAFAILAGLMLLTLRGQEASGRVAHDDEFDPTSRIRFDV